MRLLPLEVVADKVGISGRQLYVEQAEGRFPRAVQITARRVGWVESEVDDWIAAKIAARDAELTQ